MLLYLVASIVLALCGVLAASNVIVSSKPDAAELIEKLRPYQGCLGVTSLICGVLLLLNIVLHLPWFRLGTLIIALCVAAVQIALGLLLGYGLIERWANPQANKNIAEARGKLLAYQVPLGIVGIVLGVLGILQAL